MSKKALGKGLNALFSEDPVDQENDIKEVDIYHIQPDKNQPRKNFDTETLNELAQSIKRSGVLQPILVREEKPNTYTIIAGERRWRAAKRYHELWEIEHSFRITKSDLETRPVYVTLKQRIEGHFLTCFIALLILRLLAKRLNKEYAPEQIIKSLRKYQACLVKDNVYRVAYYDPLLKDIGNALNLVLNQRFLKPGAIRQLIADTKR
jgi:hypothetical protein